MSLVRAPTQGLELASPPNDGVTSVSFCRSGNQSLADLLLVSSWDKTLSVHSVSSNTIRYSFLHEAPVLDACFGREGTEVFSAGLDKTVVRHALGSEPTGHGETIGTHDQPVKCLCYAADNDLLVSGSWDKTVRAWDPRQPSAGPEGSKPAAKLPLPGKVFSMDSHGHRLVVAMANRKISIYDTRKLDPKQAELETETLLKHQTRAVRCFPNGMGYAVASIEGRVSLEYFDRSEEQQKKSYAFKCHRRVEGGTEYIFPVNAIAFHPKFGTFATGGCDGVVNTWDGENKKRLYQYSKYQTSIAALSFNQQGTKLAVAASYTFEQGEKDHPLDAIFVRDVNENEVKPKAKKQ